MSTVEMKPGNMILPCLADVYYFTLRDITGLRYNYLKNRRSTAAPPVRKITKKPSVPSYVTVEIYVKFD